MAKNALVAWVPHRTPWIVERQLIATSSLPLNLDHNEAHPRHGRPSRLRREAKQRARELPICA
jgi:hypothetical protein